MARTLDNYGPVPAKLQPDSDTDPEPFGPSREPGQDDTAKRCYMCGRGDLSGYDAGIAYAIRELRKWLAGLMPGSQAIAVTDKFRQWLRR